MNDFFEQYKHPLWQKKRLEALQAADFVCNCCMSESDQLHVHHKVYVKGRKVWEYEASELEVLCETCHKDAHKYKEALNKLLLLLPVEGLRDVIGVISGYCARVNGPAGIDVSGIDVDAPYQEMIGLIAGAIAAESLPISTLQTMYGCMNSVGHIPPKAWKVKKSA